jgi:hypothetical protein
MSFTLAQITDNKRGPKKLARASAGLGNVTAKKADLDVVLARPRPCLAYRGSETFTIGATLA